MNVEITLPQNHNMKEWLNISNDIYPYIDKAIILIVDFKYVRFLDTKNLVILACYLELFYKKGTLIQFKNIDGRIKQHLENIGFENYFNISLARQSFSMPKNNTTIPLWNIQQAESFNYAFYAQGFLKWHFNNKNLLFVQTNLDEIFNNIFDHANSAVNGFVITQYYPNINQISYSICDLGLGIPKTINDMRLIKGETILSDSDAILLSTKAKVSAKSKPHNRGLGLNNIIDICNNSLGTVEIFSNSGYFFSGLNSQINSHEINFTGTLINININTLQLEDEDTEIGVFS